MLVFEISKRKNTVILMTFHFVHNPIPLVNIGKGRGEVPGIARRRTGKGKGKLFVKFPRDENLA